MLSVIDEIIAIDKNAREQINEANTKAEVIRSDAKNLTEQIKLEYADRVKKRLDKVRESYTSFAEEEIAALRAKEAEAIKKVEVVMSDNCDRWNREIINRIIG